MGAKVVFGAMGVSPWSHSQLIGAWEPLSEEKKKNQELMGRLYEREGRRLDHPEFIVAEERRGGTSPPHKRKQRDWLRLLCWCE